MGYNIWLTSDLHLGHDRDFLLGNRGCSNIIDHDTKIINNWNNLIAPEDVVYLLGDVMLRDVDNGLKLLCSLNGSIHIIRGNHDTDEKILRYRDCKNVVEICDAKYIRCGKKTLYLSHFPTIVSHSKLKSLKKALINCFGHTHQKENFFIMNGTEHPYMYHVGVDSHDLKPVLLDDVLFEVENQKRIFDSKHDNIEGV